MKRFGNKVLTGTVCLLTTTAMLAGCGSSGSSAVASSQAAAAATTEAAAAATEAASEAATTAVTETAAAGGELSTDTTEISIYYPDNATLPYKEDWLSFKTVQENSHAKLDVQAIPIADYSTKVSLALNTGSNAPDVILYQDTSGENSSLALNGAIVPISDYSDWTPNFNAWVEKFGLQDELNNKKLKDGKLYYLPALYDNNFYDGGLILREDYLESKGFDAPKTFDDLYEILKAYKEDNPDSYPLTILAGPRVLFRFTMPSFGISVGKNSSSGSYTLSYDYDKQEYFEGAVDDKCKAYFEFLAKLYKEGLLDPEMADPIDGDKWAQKMADGSAMATWAYYDQIGGVESASTIDGFKLQMYPPLEGTDGAHTQPKSRVGAGIMFPAATAERDDFEQVVRKIDDMFYGEENAKVWCLGVEGTTYTMDGDTIVYSDDLKNSDNGILKQLQIDYGCGAAGTQQVWVLDQELTKYDDNYKAINEEVAKMDDAIQSIPPTPLFDDLTAEDAASLSTPLADKFEVWADAFITGAKDVDADWDTYVSEMKDLGIDEYCQMYNDNLAR